VRNEHQLDLRKAATKDTQDWRQTIGKYAFGCADAQWAAWFVAIANGPLALFHCGKSLFGKWQKTAACVGERNATAEAIARVILHEWVHVATQNPRHTEQGISKQTFGVKDLLTEDEAMQRNPPKFVYAWRDVR